MRFSALNFLTILLVTGIPAFAQTWCPPGAVWHYRDYDHYLKRDVVIEYRYERDTILLNKKCHVLDGTMAGKLNYYDSFFVAPTARFFTYLDNNVIYLYNAGSFDTVVDFSAKVGDRWRIPGGCGNNVMTVTDTGHAVINGHFLKTIKVSYKEYDLEDDGMDDDDSLLFPMETTIYERLIKTDGMRVPFLLNCYQMHGFHRTFSCYKDDSFQLYNPWGQDCREYVGVSEGAPNRAIIYPVPFTNKLVVLTENGLSSDLKLEMVNAQGAKMVFQQRRLPTNELEIDTGSFPPGVYVLHIYDKGLSVSSRKVICEPRQ